MIIPHNTMQVNTCKVFFEKYVEFTAQKKGLAIIFQSSH